MRHEGGIPLALPWGLCPQTPGIFTGMNSGVQWVLKKQALGPPGWPRALTDAPLAHRRPGYPSVRLRPRRACLRFTRPADRTQPGRHGQEQVTAEPDGPACPVNP